MGNYRVGIMTGIDTSKSGNPQKVIDCIRLGRKLDLDLLVGPEWSLTPEAKWTLRADAYNRYGVPTRFYPTPNAPLSPVEPNDAGNALVEFLEQRSSEYEKSSSLERDEIKHDITRFSNFVLKLPYSMKEASKLLRAIIGETRGSDMLVMPGTTMIYTETGNLYNYMPIFAGGRMVDHCFKVENGGSSAFNIGFLRFRDRDTDKSMMRHQVQRLNGVFNYNGLRFGVEICADCNTLANVYKLKDLDIQVLSSCGIRSSKPAVSYQGYIVCADGSNYVSLLPEDYSKDYVSNHASLQLTVSEEIGGKLRVFELPRISKGVHYGSELLA